VAPRDIVAHVGNVQTKSEVVIQRMVLSRKILTMFGVTDSAPKGDSCPWRKHTTVIRDSNSKNGNK